MVQNAKIVPINSTGKQEMTTFNPFIEQLFSLNGAFHNVQRCFHLKKKKNNNICLLNGIELFSIQHQSKKYFLIWDISLPTLW